jgi:hypothetical protein
MVRELYRLFSFWAFYLFVVFEVYFFRSVLSFMSLFVSMILYWLRFLVNVLLGKVGVYCRLGGDDGGLSMKQWGWELCVGYGVVLRGSVDRGRL